MQKKPRLLIICDNTAKISLEFAKFFVSIVPPPLQEFQRNKNCENKKFAAKKRERSQPVSFFSFSIARLTNCFGGVA